jgi:hypothetical protein
MKFRRKKIQNERKKDGENAKKKKKLKTKN